MRGRDWAEPFGAMAAAHDMLEHFPRDTGRLEEELQAFGAMRYVRGNGWDWADSASSDFVQLSYWLCFTENRSEIDEPPPTEPCEYDADFVECIRKARRLVRNECSDGEPMHLWINTRIIGWLRRGYARAVRRYKGKYMANMFHRLQNSIDFAFKYAEEGDLVRARCNYLTGEVHAKHVARRSY